MKDIEKTIEILQAYRNGKPIEMLSGDKWVPLCNIDMHTIRVSDINWYRIKKEPIYRPYNGVDEFLKASKEHGNAIRIKKMDVTVFPVRRDGNSIGFMLVNGSVQYVEYSVLFEDFVWEDDKSPCGVLTTE